MSGLIASNKIKIYYLYIENNELNFIKSENLYLINDEVLEKELLIKLIYKNKIENEKKYKLKTIMKFNVNVKNICNDDILLEECENLSTEGYVRDIHFNNLSYIFENINSLFIIFNRVTTNKKINLTKKIYHKTNKTMNKTRSK